MSADNAAFINADLEKVVLGQILAFRMALPLYLSAGLTGADFGRVAHQQIFDAILAVEQAGSVPDLVTVGMELRRRKLLEAVEVGYFTDLTTGVIPPAEGAPVLIAGELADLAGKRAVALALGKGHGLEDLAATLDKAIHRGPEERRTYDSAGQLETIRGDITRDKAGRIWLGIPTLDNILEGLRPGEVFGLMARPGIGKTLVLGHVARAVAETEFGHVFFSLEMPAPQIVERIARAHYGLDRYRLRERLEGGGIDAGEYVEYFKRFVLVDTPGLDVARMASKLRQIQAGPLKGVPLRLVTVDHLGLIGGDRKMSTYDRVSMQARELKELAKRFDCTVLLAVQVNREAGGDGSKELGLGAARDSGVVEEAMDYLVAMRRLDRSQTLSSFERDRYRDCLFLKVVKNRHGAPDAEVGIRLDGRTLALTEDPDLRIAEDDLSKIAAMAGRRR